MARRSNVITLGDLLDEHGESEQDERILSRLKALAQESLPAGWNRWEVSRAPKEEIFGDKLNAHTLDKLMFALPTVSLVRAFDPEINHLSEIGYSEIKLKLLDWAFTRALILGPPSIANKIHGSAAQTELFKKAVECMNPDLHTRKEADIILTGHNSESNTTNRKRRDTSTLSEDQPKQCKVDQLEENINTMFSIITSKIEALKPGTTQSEVYSESGTETGWEAPSINIGLDSTYSQGSDMKHDVIDFRPDPDVKVAEPLVPEPTSEIELEGIECQRLGAEGWSLIRYKEAEQRLQATPVFSALKMNTVLQRFNFQCCPVLEKMDGVLGTISHGLLLQRKALAKGINKIVKDHPEVTEHMIKLIDTDSPFRKISDDLLQFVCARRAETIERRRKMVSAKNASLTAALQLIPPSTTHLFEEKALTDFIRDNGGAEQVFRSGFNRFSNRKQIFRKRTGSFRHQKLRNPLRSNPTSVLSSSSSRSTLHRPARRTSGGARRSAPRKRAERQQPGDRRH